MNNSTGKDALKAALDTFERSVIELTVTNVLSILHMVKEDDLIYLLDDKQTEMADILSNTLESRAPLNGDFHLRRLAADALMQTALDARVADAKMEADSKKHRFDSRMYAITVTHTRKGKVFFRLANNNGTGWTEEWIDLLDKQSLEEWMNQTIVENGDGKRMGGLCRLDLREMLETGAKLSPRLIEMANQRPDNGPQG